MYASEKFWGRRALSIGLLLLCLLGLTGCQVEVYTGLNESQANTMLATLLKRGIKAEKSNKGKQGFSLSVESDNLIQTFDILNKNSLPSEKYATMGEVFSGGGMIASPTEEQARMAFAISQELAGTFSRIDGVLTARVHVVLAGVEKTTDARTPASASVFLRHVPQSPVEDLIAQIRELASKAVPALEPSRVTVMLVSVRDAVSVPMTSTPSLFGIPLFSGSGSFLLLVGAALFVVNGVLLVLLLHFFFKKPDADKMDTKEALPSSKDG